MRTGWNFAPARLPVAMDAMTHRIYVRWPAQRTTDKTTTESRKVGQLAFDELRERANALHAEGALGIAWTEDGKQIEYLTFGESDAGSIVQRRS